MGSVVLGRVFELWTFVSAAGFAPGILWICFEFNLLIAQPVFEFFLNFFTAFCCLWNINFVQSFLLCSA